MRNHFKVTYSNRWIGRGGPVLIPVDYFLWGIMKSMVSGIPVTSEEDIKLEIGRGGPVLIPLDYFLWGIMKSMVLGIPVTSEEDLIERVHGAIAMICCTCSVYRGCVEWAHWCSIGPKPCCSVQGFHLEKIVRLPSCTMY